MKDELCRAFCDALQVRSVPAGLAVRTAFSAPDGDLIGFYIRDEPGGYRIEDSGTTLPALEAEGLDFRSGSRGAAMDELLQEYGVALDEEGRQFAIDGLREQEVPAAAMRFVAFSLRVRDFALMTEARIVSTFREDVRKLLTETVGERAAVEESAAISPALADFPADFVLRPAGRPPVGVFLGTGDNRVLEAILVQMRALYETREICSVIALLERGKSITGHVRQQAGNRLTAVAEFRGDEIASIQRIAHEAFGQSQALH
jgi:hypothetical protein